METNMPLRTLRFSMAVTPAELEAVKEARFIKRLNSDSEAVRRYGVAGCIRIVGRSQKTLASRNGK